MPKPTKGARLGGGAAHERLILANLASALITNKSIKTTETKAKRLRPVAERLVTFGKRGDLASRRRALSLLRNKEAVHILFTEIAPQVADREGGYTRIVKIGPRKGDNAPMAVIELVLEPVTPKVKSMPKGSAGASDDAAVVDASAADATSLDDVASTDAASADAADASTDDAATANATESADGASDDATGGAAADDAATADAEDSADSDAADAAAADSADTPAEDGAAADGQADPLEDGSAPEGFDVKGKNSSKKYYEPGAAGYAQVKADVYFRDAAAAEAAGFAS